MATARLEPMQSIVLYFEPSHVPTDLFLELKSERLFQIYQIYTINGVYVIYKAYENIYTDIRKEMMFFFLCSLS